MPLLAPPEPSRNATRGPNGSIRLVDNNGNVLLEDIEAFCRRVLHDYARHNSAHYNASDEEDAVAYLLGIIWRLPTLYERKPRNVNFRTYAYRLLSIKCAQELRERLGRTRWTFGDGTTYERETPIVLHLDAPTTEGDPGTLGDSIGIRDPRLEDDRDTAARRLLNSRTSEATRAITAMDQALQARTAA